MAVAVASTSTVTGNDQDTLTITAPSGIATDDLLLIVASGGTYSVTSTGFTEVHSASVNGPNVGQDGQLNVLYKIAVLADESATDYTLATAADGQLGAAAMFRITGWNTGDPLRIKRSGTTFVRDGEDLELSIGVSGVDRPTSQINFIATSAFDNDSMVGEYGVSNYSITSSDANPTWTEVIDHASYQTGDSLSRHGTLAVAYATSTDTSDVTAFGFDIDTTSLDETAYIAYTYFTIHTPQSDSDSNTLITTDTTLFTATGTTSASASNTLLTTTTTVNNQSGTATSLTQWTNDSEPSTTWSNET